MRCAQALFGVLAIVLSGCSDSGNEEPGAGDGLRFDGAAAHEILGELMRPGPRYTGSFSARLMLKRIRADLEKAGAEVVTQEFERQVLDSDEVLTLVNVLGRFAPENHDRVAIVTHHDTRREAELDPDESMRNLAIPGANDGGSGTAILMALIPLLGAKAPPCGVDLIFFDGEEWGKPGRSEYCQGSKYLSRKLQEVYPEKPPRWVICIDMVGDMNQQIRVEASSQRQAPKLTQAVFARAASIGASGFVRTAQWGPIEDDHTVFLQAGIPATLLIDYDYTSPDGKVSYYHTHQDTLDKVSPVSLEQVGRVMESMIYSPELE